MKRIPNYMVSELIRLIPVLIRSIPTEGQSLHVVNANRLTKNITKKLKSLKDEEK